MNSTGTTVPRASMSFLSVNGVYSLHCKFREDNSERTFELKKLSSEELLHLRETTQNPIFILKFRNEYFYSSIPEELSFLAQPALGKHLCTDCKKGYPGMCPKVRDVSYFPSKSESLLNTKRIEKYGFILRGFETFGNEHEVFVVSKCTNFI